MLHATRDKQCMSLDVELVAIMQDVLDQNTSAVQQGRKSYVRIVICLVNSTQVCNMLCRIVCTVLSCQCSVGCVSGFHSDRKGISVTKSGRSITSASKDPAVSSHLFLSMYFLQFVLHSNVHIKKFTVVIIVDASVKERKY